MTSRTRTAFLTAALATTFGLSGCGGQAQDAASLTQAAEKATLTSQAGLEDVSIYAQACAVRGDTSNPYPIKTYDFHYSMIGLDRYVGHGGVSYTIMFNDITNPKVMAEVEAAYKLLPASANCPAPVFGKPASTPGA